MKVYAAQEETITVIPTGDKLPKNPRPGVIFKLMADQPVTNTVDRWYGAGVYIYDHGVWNRLVERERQIKAVEIAPRVAAIDHLLRHKERPVASQGLPLGDISMSPINRASTYAGTASLWVEASEDCRVALAVYRNSLKLISMSVEALTAGQQRGMQVSFVDMPFTGSALGQSLGVDYTLCLHVDTATPLAVNRGGTKFLYDDVAPSSAFIVHEITVT